MDLSGMRQQPQATPIVAAQPVVVQPLFFTMEGRLFNLAHIVYVTVERAEANRPLTVYVETTTGEVVLDGKEAQQMLAAFNVYEVAEVGQPGLGSADGGNAE